MQEDRMSSHYRYEYPRRLLLCALLLAFCSLSCSVPVDGSELGTEGADVEPGSVTQEIANGTLTQKAGVVQIIFQDGSICTGAMISPRAILTAAHCPWPMLNGSREGYLKASVRYYDPEMNWFPGLSRWVTTLGEQDWFYANVNEYFEYDSTGRRAYDFAVLNRFAGNFINTSSIDYLRLGLGTCDQIDRNELFGAGAYNTNLDVDNKLRSMPIDIYSCASQLFYDLRGSRQPCHGDSGGPHINKAGPYDVIVGLHGGNTPGGNCSPSGAKQYAARMTEYKVDWIQERLWGGYSCAPYQSGGYYYRRCW